MPLFSSLTDFTLGQDCALCGSPTRRGLVCAPCESALPAFRGADCVAPFEYRYPVDRLVRRFKFAGDLSLGRWLALRLAASVRDAPRPDLLVAPPLARRRLRERGFNQALEIAKVVGRELDLEVPLAALEKRVETASQPGLTRRERYRNLRGAFAPRRRFDGLHVAIVDDVVTTGATSGTLAAILRGAGARQVSVWALARTPLG
jgi:ComF family protein